MTELSTTDRRAGLSRAGMVLRGVGWATAAFAAVLVGGALSRPDALGDLLASGLPAGLPPLSGGQTLALAVLAAAQAGLWSAAAFDLGATLRAVAAGRRDAALAARSRRAPILIWIALALSVAGQVPASAIASWGMPAGQRFISIGIGSPQLLALIAALVAAGLAQAVAVIARLSDDLEGFV